MRKLSLFILCFLPFTTLAQTGPNVPVIIVDHGNIIGTEPAPEIAKPVPGHGFANFPDIAVTRIGENTTGQHVDNPDPGANLSPAPAASGPVPATPASPTPPPSPAAKLWPRDTVGIFMPSCIGYHPEFATACGCVISKLMSTMPHDEFLRESDAGTIEGDARITQIRTDCASAPKKKED